MTQEVQFTPVETGDMSDIPPDAPAGKWVMSVTVKRSATKPEKGSFPMLILDYKLEEALTEGNENHVGVKVSDFLVLYPGTHANSRFGKAKAKELAEVFGIEAMDTSSLASGSWESVLPFIDAIESTKVTAWTYIKTDKTSGEKRAQISFRAPKGEVQDTAGGDGEDSSLDAEPVRNGKKKRRN